MLKNQGKKFIKSHIDKTIAMKQFNIQTVQQIPLNNLLVETLETKAVLQLGKDAYKNLQRQEIIV